MLAHSRGKHRVSVLTNSDRVVSRELQNYHYSPLGRPIKSVPGKFVRKAECQRMLQSSPESSRLRICMVKVEQHWAPTQDGILAYWKIRSQTQHSRSQTSASGDKGQADWKDSQGWERLSSIKLGHAQLLGQEHFLQPALLLQYFVVWCLLSYITMVCRGVYPRSPPSSNCTIKIESRTVHLGISWILALRNNDTAYVQLCNC